MSEQPSSTSRIRDSQRITLIGAVVNVLLAAVKILLGTIGNSYALVVDGIHSLADLATDLLVVVVAHHGGADADEDHPYGHQRIETAASVALGVLLALTGIGILWDAIDRLFETERLLTPGLLAITGALLSIVAKEALYHYTRAVAQRIKSPLLLANAWHHRSDAISSVVVLIGIVGTMAGLDYLDAIAATVVALMIVHIGWGLAWSALRELVDTGLDADRLASIREVIGQVPGVQALHMLRTRRMGEAALVDVHIQLDNPHASVSEGHQISETVRSRLVNEVEEVSDVTVHIDPEDDANAAPCCNLPLRHELLPQLQQAWQAIPEAAEIQDTTLHYLSGEVQIELRLPLRNCRDDRSNEALQQRFQQAVADLPGIGPISLLYQ